MRKIPGLDFLRGVSVIVVMSHHFEITDAFTRGGWIGVDMFFLLSGFLVSGLLFNEYNLTGKIRPLYFLVRRGFKIYPLFYFAVLFHLAYFFAKGIEVTRLQVLAEVFFFQNYTTGLMGISWSLAVEEHFYFSLAILLFIAFKKNLVKRSIVIPVGILLICITCFLLRLYTYTHGPYTVIRNEFPTHLRIDSLAFGVLLSYWFIYYKEQFYLFFRKYIFALLPLAVLLIAPVFIWDRGTFIITIYSHTFLFTAFGIIMSSVIVYSKELVNLSKKYKLLHAPDIFIAWIGTYSYGIYLFHLKVGPIVSNWVRVHLDSNFPKGIYFLIYLIANISAGVILSKIIEHPFLKLRERYFPRIKAERIPA